MSFLSFVVFLSLIIWIAAMYLTIISKRSKMPLQLKLRHGVMGTSRSYS